jgi:hypothetical protein
VIRAVAFCPHPPLLVPEVAQAAAPELDELRAACREAIRRVAVPGARLLVVGAGERWQRHGPTARGSLAGYGVPIEIPLGSDEPGPVELPLSLTIGAWLLRDALGPNCGATGASVARGQTMIDLPPDHDVALLVMGDGSARRSTSAPGYFDERAPGFDAGLAEALRSGKRPALQADVGLGDQLLATAPRVWAALLPRLDGVSYRAELLYDAAPYGVGYFVAVWT